MKTVYIRLSVISFCLICRKKKSCSGARTLQSPELSTVVFAPPGSHYRDISGTSEPKDFVNNEPQTTVNFAFDKRWQGSVRLRF